MSIERSAQLSRFQFSTPEINISGNNPIETIPHKSPHKRRASQCYQSALPFAHLASVPPRAMLPQPTLFLIHCDTLKAAQIGCPTDGKVGHARFRPKFRPLSRPLTKIDTKGQRYRSSGHQR